MYHVIISQIFSIGDIGGRREITKREAKSRRVVFIQSILLPKIWAITNVFCCSGYPMWHKLLFLGEKWQLQKPRRRLQFIFHRFSFKSWCKLSLILLQLHFLPLTLKLILWIDYCYQSSRNNKLWLYLLVFIVLIILSFQNHINTRSRYNGM